MMPNLKDKTGCGRLPVFFPNEEFFNYCNRFGSFFDMVWHTDGNRSHTGGGGKPFSLATSEGDTWNISLTHSVEKTKWEEFFRVNGVHDMTMTHTHFESLGWGYPYSASDGKLSRTNDGRFCLKMDRPYKDIALRVSEQAMQQLVHGDEVYDLVALYGQGTAVEIKAQYRYEYWSETYF